MKKLKYLQLFLINNFSEESSLLLSLRQKFFSFTLHTITATTQSLVRVTKPHPFQFFYPTMSGDQGNGDGLIPDHVPSPAVEPPNGEQVIDGDDSTSPPARKSAAHN